MSGALSGQRVLVTGGAGFLGSSIVRRLAAEDPADIFVPRSAMYDLRDRSATERMLRDARPDIVIHAAAVVGGIGANAEQPGSFFYENAIMGIQLVEECRLAEVGKLVTVGTICSYPKFTPVPFTEDHLWDGYPEETNAPYGLAKKMVLVQQQAYHQQYGMNAVFLMPANLYGPGDNFDPRTAHVIPDLIRKFVHAHESGAPEVSLWGTGSPSRDFLYVDDAAEGVVLAAAHYDNPEPVNLGTGREITIRTLATIISGAVGFQGELAWDDTKPDGQPRRAVDSQLAKEHFGFDARTSFEDGLRTTVDWYLRERPF
jgi:GDP-L-fucose synthase